jgi:hypothetical protein
MHALLSIALNNAVVATLLAVIVAVLAAGPAQAHYTAADDAFHPLAVSGGR